MSYLVVFSFVALIIERILQFIDWLFSWMFSPQHKVMEDLRKQILSYKERAEKYKQTYLAEIEKVKNHPITDAEFENLMQISQQYVGLSDAEVKDLMKIWQDYQHKRQRYVAIKMITMWILGFGLSFGFCILFDYTIMGKIGIESLTQPEMVKIDYILTAILLGSGTKPVHDLLSMLSARAKGKA